MYHLLFCRALAVAACLLLSAPALGATDEATPLAPPAKPVAVADAGDAIGAEGPGDTAGAAETTTPPAERTAAGRALIDAGRFAATLNVLRPLVSGNVVEARALFLYGLAALGASQQADVPDEEREVLLDEAIAAFHVMLVQRPDLVRVRLELARAFFLKGEDELARRHFEAVLAGGVPEPVVANIRRFLLEIEGRERWSFRIGAALAPDSNIGAGSEERTIYLHIFGRPLPFERDAEELTTSGIGVAVWGGAEYQYVLDEALRLRAGGEFSRREYERSEFDQFFLGTHLGPRWQVDEDTGLSLLASARQRWVGTAPDNRELGGRLEAVRRLSQSVTAFARASWHERRYRIRDHLDGPVMDVSLRGAWVVTPTLRASLSAGYGRERPEQERARNRSRWLGLGVDVALPLGFTVGAGAEVRWTDFEDGWFPNTPPGEDRADRTHSLRLSVHHRGFTFYGFSPELVVVNETRETNAQAYDLRRTRGELRFVRQY